MKLKLPPLFEEIVKHDRRKPDLNKPVVKLAKWREWRTRSRKLIAHVERGYFRPSKGGPTTA